MPPQRPGEERAGTGWSRTAPQLQPGFAKIQLPKFPETKVPGPAPRLSPDIGPKDSDQEGQAFGPRPSGGRGRGLLATSPPAAGGQKPRRERAPGGKSICRGGAVLGRRTAPR